MDALRAEVSLLHNIRVTNVLPGSVATDVSRNALTADGSVRARSDANIEGGDDPAACANAILEAVKNNVPELIFAKGMELDLARMRHEDPEKVFGLLAGLAVQLAEEGIPE
jgi:short-subunit dehydrogenase